MNWELSIGLLLETSILFGWSYYPSDDDHDYNEFVLYLGLFSINYKWRR
jgi:hypothetical protein